MNTLRATDVADPETLAEWGLDSPAFKLTVSQKEGDELIIEGGRPDPATDGYIRVASNDDATVYKLSKYTFEQLFPKGEDLFDLPKLSLAADQINRLELTSPDGKFVAEKQDDAWTVTEPAVGLPVQKSKLEAMATAVASLQASDYADSAPGAFDTSLTVQAGGVSRDDSAGRRGEGV